MVGETRRNPDEIPGDEGRVDLDLINPIDRTETRMDELRLEIENRYHKRMDELVKCGDLVKKEFGLDQETFEKEMRAGQSSTEVLDALMHALYKKGEEIDEERKRAIESLRKKLKEEIEAI